MGFALNLNRYFSPDVSEYESDYSHIYGRLPLPTRFRQFPGGGGGGAHGKRHVYVSEWE